MAEVKVVECEELTWAIEVITITMVVIEEACSTIITSDQITKVVCNKVMPISKQSNADILITMDFANTVIPAHMPMETQTSEEVTTLV